MLNRIRKGEQTKDDIEKLIKRVRPEGHSDLEPEAIRIYCKNKAIYEYSSKKLNEMEGKLYTVKAKQIMNNYKSFVPKVNKTTGFKFQNRMPCHAGI